MRKYMCAERGEPLDFGPEGHFYNAGAWTDPNGRIVVLPRWVTKVDGTKPDIGHLVIATLEGTRPEGARIVWSPGDQGISSLEDPRAITLDGKVIIGLTAVFKQKDKSAWYPAIAEVERSFAWATFPSVRVIRQYGLGKNMTPLGIPEHNHLAAFRPNRWSHKLIVIDYRSDEPQKVGELDFSRNSVPPWGAHKMGTGVPPLWLDAKHALMIIHGMTYDRARNFYKYSIGKAILTRLDKGFDFEVKVDPRPLLTCEDFAGYPQLHPTLRDAIYTTSGFIDGECLKLLVSVGDFQTLIIPFTLSELTQN